MNGEIVVTIRCCTYNHEPYIRQCLEGFVMQQANFPFEAIVHDDASTDGTAEIVKEYAEKYPNIIKPIFEKENLYSKHDGSITRIMNEHTRGKYVAICEGDDYWTDPLKLQKQVDFLENHPEYSMCCTDAYQYNQANGKLSYYSYTQKRNIVLEDLLYSGNKVLTLTVLYRKDWLADYRDAILNAPKWPMGDYPQWIWLSAKGPIYKIPEVTAVYRVLAESASHSKDLNKTFFFGLSGFEMCLYFCTLLHKKHFYTRLSRIWYILRYVIRYFPKQNDKLKYCLVSMYD